MILISHAAEWGKERIFNTEYLRAWYLQPFNVGMHILIGCVTQALLDAMLTSRSLTDAGRTHTLSVDGLSFLVFTLVAVGIYLLLNHFLVGSALVLARRIPWEDSGVLDHDSLLIDFAMLVMGVTVATLVDKNSWLIFPTIAPLYLIYRALSIPHLKRQASTDAKTGLWNSEYFRKTLESEMARAMRFTRPMAVVVADLDLLRNINNVYGHLAGDVVLVGVANILKENLRDTDTVSRFGGEEFAILMPETTPEQALPRIEDIRRKIAQANFHAPLTKQLVKATMSFGITGIALADRTTIDLIHRADMAVYAAKMRGRNQTCLADAPQPTQFSLEERLTV
jgi:diguanylate cyclase (GGDEF)-like protein